MVCSPHKEQTEQVSVCRNTSTIVTLSQNVCLVVRVTENRCCAQIPGSTTAIALSVACKLDVSRCRGVYPVSWGIYARWDTACSDVSCPQILSVQYCLCNVAFIKIIYVFKWICPVMEACSPVEPIATPCCNEATTGANPD